MEKNKELIIISAQNLIEGGALSILLEVFLWACEQSRYRFIFIVHSKKLLTDKEYPHIEFFEIPSSKKNWANRLFFEYVYFYFFSLRKRPTLWFSLHDVTPVVHAPIRAVYCHNPACFYKTSLKDFLIDRKFYLFSKFYKYLYGVNIKKNNAVCVQQQWIADEFSKMFAIENLVVTPPDRTGQEIWYNTAQVAPPKKDGDKVRFLYPSYPRSFKNFEIICEAVEHIDKKLDFEVLLTIDGSENRYSAGIINRYQCDPRLKFIGIQPRQRIFELYKLADALIFPSKLETWGVPLSEFSLTGKPIFAADLIYAHETLSGYSKVCFFDPDDPDQLASFLESFIQNKRFTQHKRLIQKKYPEKQGWDQVFSHLLND